MTLMRFQPITVGAIALALLVVGCGSSTTSATSSSPGSPTKSTAAGASASTSSGATFASGSNCSALAGVGKKFEQALESSTSGGKVNLAAAASAYQTLANQAPSAIHSDVEEIAQAFTTFASAVTKSGFTSGSTPTPSQVAALESAAKTFEGSKITTASKQIEAWAKTNCG